MELDALASSSETRKSLEEEVADVFIYLVQFAESLNIDVASAVLAKIELNRARYPADQVQRSSIEHSELRPGRSETPKTN